jgi:hypothetical protein
MNPSPAGFGSTNMLANAAASKLVANNSVAKRSAMSLVFLFIYNPRILGQLLVLL